MADTQDLGSCALWRAGSSPVIRIKALEALFYRASFIFIKSNVLIDIALFCILTPTLTATDNQTHFNKQIPIKIHKHQITPFNLKIFHFISKKMEKRLFPFYNDSCHTICYNIRKVHKFNYYKPFDIIIFIGKLEKCIYIHFSI